MTTATTVPVTPTNQPASNGIITFSIGSSPNDPNAIIFGQQNTPTSVSRLEIPGRLNDLGGIQKNAVHEFPGGYRTIQPLGAFPEPLNWRGTFLGGNAFARHFQMDALRRNGKTAYLTYGPWQWEGLLIRFQTEARYQNYCAYRATFEPSIDLTAAGQAQAPSASQTANTMTQLLTNIQQQYQTDSVLSAESQAALIIYAATVVPLIQAYGQGSTQLTSSDTLALTEATGAVTAALALDALSTNPEVTYAASSTGSYVNAITGTLSSVATQTTIQVVNPNLAQLAAQYYGDATQWRTLANANNLIDMQPSGSYSLVIPNA